MTGDAIIQATVTDDSGNSSSANSEIFIPGNEREWFAGRDDDRLDFLPEKPAYEPGDVARFQVRMPFAEATALVTVEREGVLAASIVHLSGRDPVITCPCAIGRPTFSSRRWWSAAESPACSRLRWSIWGSRRSSSASQEFAWDGETIAST